MLFVSSRFCFLVIDFFSFSAAHCSKAGRSSSTIGCLRRSVGVLGGRAAIREDRGHILGAVGGRSGRPPLLVAVERKAAGRGANGREFVAVRRWSVHYIKFLYLFVGFRRQKGVDCRFGLVLVAGGRPHESTASGLLPRRSFRSVRLSPLLLAPPPTAQRYGRSEVGGLSRLCSRSE